MFDTSLAALLRYAPPRLYPKMSGYLQTLNQEVLYNTHRYSSMPGHDHPGMMLLSSILNQSDLTTLREIPDHFDRYRHGIVDQLESLERNFDPVQQGINTQGRFLPSQNHRTRQVLLPVRCESPYSDLPMGLDWGAWSRVRPLRLAYVDSTELTFHTYQDVLNYRKDVPQLVVLTLNVAALVMMYSVYLDTVPNADPSPIDFLHRYVVYPALTEDNTELWIVTQYLQVLNASHETVSGTKDYVWETANNGRIGSQYGSFISDVFAAKKACESGAILPNTLLTSLKLLHGSNLQEYYQSFRRMNVVPDLNQYRWCEFLIYMRWLELFIKIGLLYKPWCEQKFTLSYLARDLRLLNNAHPWTNISDQVIRKIISDKLTELQTLLGHYYEQTIG